MAYAVAAMIAMTIVWRVQAADPLKLVPAQMEVLRRVASTHVVSIDLTSRRRLSRSALAQMRLRIPIRRGMAGASRALNHPLAIFQSIPAGVYRLSVVRHGTGDGWVMAGVGADQFAIVARPIADFDAGVRIDLPAGARSLSVRADEAARDQLDEVALEPLAPDRSAPAVAVPRRAARYGGVVVFFLDERAFPEPAGFWVAGARETEVIVSPDQGSSGTVTLVLSNGPLDNTITLAYAGRREVIVLKGGEEHRIDVLLDHARGFARVRIRSNASSRPSDADPNSRDTRPLGVFVRFQP
jgi:hypothetical protein